MHALDSFNIRFSHIGICIEIAVYRFKIIRSYRKCLESEKIVRYTLMSLRFVNCVSKILLIESKDIKSISFSLYSSINN